MSSNRIMTLADKFDHELAKCIKYQDPYRYHEVILGRKPMTGPQRRIIDAFMTHRITIVATANGMGKSYSASSLSPYLLHIHNASNPCKVVITAPTAKVMREVYWNNLRSAWEKSPYQLPGRMLQCPPRIEISPDHFLVCTSAVDTENASGYHSPNLYAIIDEASNVSADIYAAIMSWNPTKILMLGNPIRNDGFFYDLAQKALADNNPDSDMAFLQISALESPYADVLDSKTGLADKTWLNQVRLVYGENSLYWKTHVLAQFAESNSDALVPSDWLLLLAGEHDRAGAKTMAIDLGEGVGRDSSVILVRDSNGVHERISSNRWTFEDTARNAKRLAEQHGVQPSRIIYDKTGIGADFDNRLRAVGLVGCRPYKGSLEVSQKAAAKNLRSQAGWNLRRRLDPQHYDLTAGQAVKQKPFFIPGEVLSELKPQLNACSYGQLANGKVELTPKDQIAKMLGHSPDVLDALMMSFAFWR